MIKCIMNEITQNTKHSVTAVQTVFNRSYILSNNKYSVIFLKVNIQAFIKKKKNCRDLQMYIRYEKSDIGSA